MIADIFRRELSRLSSLLGDRRVPHLLFQDVDLLSLMEKYKGTRTQTLSYATVKDFCDSFDNLTELATYAEDLKNVQRCWALKMVLATVPQRGRILEIGAGEPIVADILQRIGFQVTIVDPYEGFANGPTDIDYYKGIYPNIRFVVDYFGANTNGLDVDGYDACYSISVLEHIPLGSFDDFFLGIKKFMKSGANSIHAVDFVLKGPGADYHLAMLERVTDGHGISREAVNAALIQAEGDPETYFLSAEAHNRWRGKLAYADFPMRRCISMQIATTVPAQ